jgi:lipopolysaccharide/colanic/teichoic acid biosynthesis glycosyltransferase
MLERLEVAERQQVVVVRPASRDSRLYYACKRCIDVGLAALVLILLFPLMLFIALLIKLDTPGPVLFVQERVGARRRRRNGRTTWEIQNFSFYKFRSMIPRADPSLHQAFISAFVKGQVEPSNTNGAQFKLNRDPRVTRVGRVLRKTSLDELPQFINVLKGDMSLVGPRPPIPYEVELYQDWHKRRLEVLPGITGWWQVKGRSQVSFDDMVRMDLYYIEHASLALDLQILLMTPRAVLSGRGAA